MSDDRPRRSLGMLRRLAVPIAAVVAAFLVWQVALPWLGAWYGGLERETRRWLVVGFLQGLLAAYGIVLVLGPIVAAVAAWRLVKTRKTGPRPIWARLLAVSVSTLMALGIVEAAAGRYLGRHENAEVSVPPPALTAGTDSKRPREEILLLVLGESSALGEPYHPWLSIGHIVAREIEKALPGRKVRIIMGARSGAPLTPMLDVLSEQAERPDLVLLYSGHNEFQARYAWYRTVNYYWDDVFHFDRPALSRIAGEWTPLCRIVRQTIDQQFLDVPPPTKPTRLLVDRPCCTERERREVLEVFEKQVEAVVGWCEKAGALPIVFIPAGNDVGFDPDRSVLDPMTLLKDRDAFEAEFRRVRASEATDPEGALASYRRLIAAQPGFAESHYRLALALRARGEHDEARREFRRARDLDGLPMRCPSDFQDAYRRVASRHDFLLIDSPAVIAKAAPSGYLDDSMFNDGQHPSLKAYTALASAAIDQLRKRGAVGLPKTEAPPLDPAVVAKEYGMDAKRWAEVARRVEAFWRVIAYIRFDPSMRLEKAKRYRAAVEKIQAGMPPEDAGFSGLGTQP